jgi:hypothetical protein
MSLYFGPDAAEAGVLRPVGRPMRIGRADVSAMPSGCDPNESDPQGLYVSVQTHLKRRPYIFLRCSKVIGLRDSPWHQIRIALD